MGRYRLDNGVKRSKKRVTVGQSQDGEFEEIKKYEIKDYA